MKKKLLALLLATVLILSLVPFVAMGADDENLTAAQVAAADAKAALDKVADLLDEYTVPDIGAITEANLSDAIAVVKIAAEAASAANDAVAAAKDAVAAA